jgi:ribosomal-protein-alanine N-acetyltransferase
MINNIKLRKFKLSDSDILSELANNKNIWDNVRNYFPHPYTAQNAMEFINFCNSQEPYVTFAIEYRGALAGCVGLVPQKDVHRLTAELGYWIGEPYWGKGIATEAVNLITEYGFNQLNLIRIYSGIFDFNKASQKVLEKAGFKFECIFEKSMIKNNVICNEYRYSKVKSESIKLFIPSEKKVKSMFSCLI